MENKIGNVAGLLEIPTYRVKEAVGLPLKPCLAKTIKEAKAIHDAHFYEEKRAAYLRWDELSLVEGEKNDDIFELKVIWENAPSGGRAQKYILKKIRAICIEKLSTYSYKQAKKINDDFNKDIKIAKLIVTRMISQSSDQAEALESFEAATELGHYDLEQEAIKKIYDFTE